MENNFKNKYLKYKNKYLRLKNKITIKNKCPCLEYAGIENGYKTCYVSEFNKNKPQGCNLFNTKQSSIVNYRKWYRECDNLDNYCPESRSNDNHIQYNKSILMGEKRNDFLNEQAEKEELARIEETYNGRYKLNEYFYPDKNEIQLDDKYLGAAAHLFNGGLMLSEIMNKLFKQKYEETRDEKFNREFEEFDFAMLGKYDKKSTKFRQPNYPTLEEMKNATLIILKSKKVPNYYLKTRRNSQFLRDILLKNAEKYYEDNFLKKELIEKINFLY